MKCCVSGLPLRYFFFAVVAMFVVLRVQVRERVVMARKQLLDKVVVELRGILQHGLSPRGGSERASFSRNPCRRQPAQQ